MPHEFATTRRVEFAETDMAGIAHFSNFFRWMESCEHEFFRSLGLSVHGGEHSQHGALGFARTHASCDYVRPVCYEDLMEVQLTVREKTAKSFTYDFDFHFMDDTGQAGKRIATGRLTVVCVSKPPGEKRLRATDVPAEIARRIDVAP